MSIFAKISENLQSGKVESVIESINRAIEKDIDVQVILEEGLIAGMTAVGKKFKAGEIFIPEVLVAARAMNKGIERLKPYLNRSGVKPRGTLLIGTVKDDLHDIGKMLVSIMFKGAGFKVIDLGVNVTPDQFESAALKYKPDVIGLSALLTTTMVNMEPIIKSLREANINVWTIVGGAHSYRRVC